MATKKTLARGARTPKKRAEKPVSEEIRRAALKAGYSPAQAATAARMAAAAAALESPETMADWSARQTAFANQPLTITLAEACDLVAHDLKPTDFQEQVFETIAREVDTLADLAEHQSGQAGFDGWCSFQNLCHRIRLAGKIAAVIGGAS